MPPPGLTCKDRDVSAAERPSGHSRAQLAAAARAQIGPFVTPFFLGHDAIIIIILLREAIATVVSLTIVCCVGSV